MILGAAGGVDPDAVIALASRMFAAHPSKNDRISRAAPAFVGGAVHDAREIEQSHFALAMPGVASSDPDYFATRLFTDVLGGGMSSRLFQIIREQKGLAYSVYAFADGYDQNGLIGTYAGADADQLPEIATIVMAQIDDLTHHVGEAELDRARALLKSSMLMSLESPAARLESGVGQIFTFGKVLSSEEVIERLDAVEPRDVKRCAARALSGKRAISIVGPGDLSGVENAMKS